MKNAIFLFLFIISLFLVKNLSSQEYDFNKHAYRFIKATDYQNDPRVHFYDVGFYYPVLEMTNSSVSILGNVRIDLNLKPEYVDELVFELKSDMIVDSVKVNGAIQSFSHDDDLIIVNYLHSTPFSEFYDVSAIVYYHGSPTDGLFYDVEYFESELFEFTYSLTEPYYAKYWFPCKQVLTDKADSSYFSIIMPDGLKAGSNGQLVNESEIGGDKKRMDWQSAYPIAYYLISVAVSNYMDFSFTSEIEEFETNVLVQNFIPNNTNYLDNNDWYIYRTHQMLDVLSNRWGLYPHHTEKYGHCIVPLGGGMEHQTMTTLGNFDFRLVVHELAHSWFGNYVTCASWQDIWINEGFASYGEYLGEEKIQPAGYDLNWLIGCQNLAKERPTGSVYVPFEELNSVARIFDYRLSYRKGACLVHMLRYITNDDDSFFAALREFLNQYGNSTATAEDLKDVLESEVGISFENFFNEWYYGEGYPIYENYWYQNGTILNLELTQTTTSSATPLFTIPMEFKILYEDSTSEIVRKNVDANFSHYQVNVAGTVADVIVNPDYWVLADVSSVQKINQISFDQKFKVYPQPASCESLTIYVSDDGSYEISLINNSGQVIFMDYVSGRELKPDFSDIIPGVYFLKIVQDDAIYTQKVVLL